MRAFGKAWKRCMLDLAEAGREDRRFREDRVCFREDRVCFRDECAFPVYVCIR
jgi:hypothetical protein